MRILEILQDKACTIFFLFFKWKLSLCCPLATGLKFFCLPFRVSCSLSFGHCNVKWTRGNFFKERLPAALVHYTSPSLKKQGICSPKLTFLHLNCHILRKCKFSSVPQLKPVSRPTRTLLQVLLSWCFAGQNLSTCSQQFIKMTTTTSFHIE